MSLVTTERMFVGHEQPDSAALSADGEFYRCYVWLSRVTWALECRVVKVQENETEVEVFSNVIESASSAEITATNGVPLDSPKIIASGTTFVVHWLQATDVTIGDPAVTRNWVLYRATMDMTAFSTTTWNNRGAVALLETHLLYDVCPVIGHATDFVVARLTSRSQITVQRFFDLDWVDETWLTHITEASLVDQNILGVYAVDESLDDDVVVSYQRDSTGQLYSVRINAGDGQDQAGPVLTFNVFDDAVSESNTHWLQVGHCRVAANRVAVVAEARAAINENQGTSIPAQAWIHHVVYRQINSDTTARVGNEHWAANLSMASRPFSYASGTSVTSPRMDVYVALTFRSVIPEKEWSQALAFICNLDFSQWSTVTDGAGLRPRPVVTIQGNSIGIPDARTSGWHPEPGDVHSGGPTKRVNHLPYASAAPPFGSGVKTRTIAMPFFNSIRTTSDLGDTDQDGDFDDAVSNTGPEGAGIRGLVFYIEDPWTVFRDATDPDQPVDNFSMPYPRAMHQSVPWGRSLFVAGGTPQLYDGSHMVECGFLWRPEVIQWSTDTGGDMETGLGTRSYYFVYSWIDRQGQEHLSGPSEVVAVNFGLDTAVRFGVRCMTISLKDATAFYPLAQSIQIQVFRTALNGTEFFRVYGKTDAGGIVDQRPRDTPVNDPETLLGYVFIDDGVSDAELANQGAAPYVYDTSGLFIEPLPQTVPAMHSVAIHSGRIVGADSLDPTRLVYSDENRPAAGAATFSAPVFGANQSFRTGEVNDTTGFQSQGNQLYQFTRNSVLALAASDAGFGALAWISTLVHDALGCVDPKSIVLFPLGIGFQSLKGYYVLARSGEASYGVLARSRDQPQSLGGAAIEDDLRLAGNIRAASHSPAEHRIDLTCNARPTVTQSWTGGVTQGSSSAGVWTIGGLDVPISATLEDGATDNDICDALVAVIQAAIDADAPDTLQFQVASVASAGDVEIELVPGQTATLTGTGPHGGSLDFTVSETISTNPQILRYHYDVEQWSTAVLPQTSAITRLSELVDGCYWQGDSGPRHVALAQGAVLIERLASDANAYADQTSTGLVGIPLDITTAWLHIAGISGAQVLDEIAVHTERDEDGAMHAVLEYDNDGSLDGQQIEPTAYAWANPAPADLRIRPRFRRTRATRLRVYEDSGVTTAGNTVSIVSFTVRVGAEDGMKKTRASARGEA